MDDFASRQKIGDTDGALVVARAMVKACVSDELLVADLAEKARYAQLLAGRLRLPVIESHKTVLAAWLSGLASTPEVFEVWKKQYELEAILGPIGAIQLDGPQSMGREILDLLTAYQQLRRENPQSAQVEVMRRELRTIWATNPRRQVILAKFVLVLNDETFLKSLEVPVAKILLVDPGEIVSAVLSLPLKAKGYQVRVVCNVQEAFVALSEQIPDVVIVEMDMPLANGLVLCTKIKADPELHHLPVILLTSSKSQRVVREGMKAGAEDVLGRPVDIELVFIKLRKILGAAVAKPQQTGGIAGSLNDIVLSDLVQILSAGGKSTKMEFVSDTDSGVLYILNGEMIEATCGDVRGEEAFYKLMAWKSGTFAAVPCEHFPERSIHLSVMSLLMEAARRNDECATA